MPTTPKAKPAREIPIAPAQAQLLRHLNAKVTAAQAQVGLALDAILAGHDLTADAARGLGGTDAAPTILLKPLPPSPET